MASYINPANAEHLRNNLSATQLVKQIQKSKLNVSYSELTNKLRGDEILILLYYSALQDVKVCVIIQTKEEFNFQLQQAYLVSIWTFSQQKRNLCSNLNILSRVNKF